MGLLDWMDESLLGQEFDRSVSEPVTAEDIREYAASIGETNPVYFADEPIAPPTFCVSFRGQRFFHPSIPPDVFMRGFDAGKDIVFGAPIRAGDVITTTNELHEAYEKTGRSGTMVFIVTRQTLTNQNGETVATIDSRFMIRPRKEKS